MASSITIDSILEDLHRSNASTPATAPHKLREILSSLTTDEKEEEQMKWQPLISSQKDLNITQEEVDKSMKRYIEKHYQNNTPFDKSELHERAYYECLAFLKADEWISSFFGLPSRSSTKIHSGLPSARTESEEKILLEKLDGLEIAISEAISLAETQSNKSESKSDLL